jgi:hypothetical protein
LSKPVGSGTRHRRPQRVATAVRAPGGYDRGTYPTG